MPLSILMFISKHEAMSLIKKNVLKPNKLPINSKWNLDVLV